MGNPGGAAAVGGIASVGLHHQKNHDSSCHHAWAMTEDIYEDLDFGPCGYLPDPPKKPGEKPDWVFGAGGAPGVPTLRPKLVMVHPGDVDLREHTTSTNQYSAGSCAGNATADSVEVLNSIEGRPPVQLSRMFVYTLARNFMDMDGDGRSDIDKDEGSFIRLNFEVLGKFGICREDIDAGKGGWPYDISKVHDLPDLKAMRSATGHRIHSYYRIGVTGDERVEEIISALRSNHPVVFGTNINSAFRKVGSLDPISPPDGVTIGGHAMLIVGYIAGKGFIIKNSWGAGWGDKGFCIMTQEYLAWDGTRDLWVPTKGMTFK